MHTQYLAARSSSTKKVAALESHNLATDLSTYPRRICSDMMQLDLTHVRSNHIAGNMAGFRNLTRTTSDRRNRCQRTSNLWQCLAFWPQQLPVRASSRSKNLSWLSPSAKNPCTRVSTSKRHTGWASAPVLTQPSTVEGAAWH